MRQDVENRCPFAWPACLLPALWRRIFEQTDETLEDDEGAFRAVAQIQEDRIEMLLERASEAIVNSLKDEQSQKEDVAQEIV